MKVRCFCVVLLVSGTLCLHADRSHPGSSAQRPEQVSQEAALLGGFLFFR
ncbi:small toxic inner membrane protein TimP [Salmonella enterica]